MSTPFSTQVLTGTDAALMRRVLDLFGAVFDARPDYCDAQPDDDYLAALLGRDTFVAIAAVAGHGVIGGLAGYVLPKFEQRRAEFYIYDLAVAEAHRRQGVATALIDELRRVASSRGIYAIFVQADHGDDPAIALYTGLGVKEDVLHFDIEP